MKTIQIMLVMCVLAIVNLSGCASVNQAYSAFGASALVSAQGAEDNVLATLKVGICATPYSAIVRHPEVVPGIEAMCLPGGQATNPAALLTAVSGVPAK